MQDPGFGGPAPVAALRVVEGSVGAQRVQFVPDQLVPAGQPERGVGGVTGLVEQVRVLGSAGGADAGQGGQGGRLGGRQTTRRGNGDGPGRQPAGGVVIPADPGVFG